MKFSADSQDRIITADEVAKVTAEIELMVRGLKQTSTVEKAFHDFLEAMDEMSANAPFRMLDPSDKIQAPARRARAARAILQKAPKARKAPARMGKVKSSFLDAYEAAAQDRVVANLRKVARALLSKR